MFVRKSRKNRSADYRACSEMPTRMPQNRAGMAQGDLVSAMLGV